MKSPYILCINPWIYDFSAYDLWSKPLGLLYVAAFLKQRGVRAGLIDCLDKHHPELLRRQGRNAPKQSKYGSGPFHREIMATPEAIKFIPRYFARYGLPEDIFRRDLHNHPRPNAIFITSGMTYWYPGPQRAVEICREIFPGVPVVLGGIYATLMPEHARQAIQPDYLITGPGEIKAAELLADILKLPHLREEFPGDIDDFPYPAFDLYPEISYLVAMASRGCPFRCTFCATYKIDENFSQRKPDKVLEELLTQTRRFGVRDVAFYDDALLMQPERRIKPILQAIKESKQPLRFHTPNGLHARFIDEELAQLMYECNFKTIRLSLESVAKERRRDIHNKVTPGEMTRAVANLVKAGFQARDLETYIIMGLPNQPLEEVIETILYANNLGVQVRLACFSPIPGTVDYRRAIENGFLPENPDPLITNKTVIPLYRTIEAYYRFQTVSQFANMLNDGVRRGVTFFQPADFRQALFKALERVGEWEQ
ncbi:MAG: B12-binding domain-containing radical SAM protein [Calditrichaceae bacterium]|nr:B12-binding domain-containing radical SAM protein [Calditrichia bacterium]NUQ41052.1 B12-binding domain-containing radical SAM protein [Calditrichaceae bacterium]